MSKQKIRRAATLLRRVNRCQNAHIKLMNFYLDGVSARQQRMNFPRFKAAWQATLRHNGLTERQFNHLSDASYIGAMRLRRWFDAHGMADKPLIDVRAVRP